MLVKTSFRLVTFQLNLPESQGSYVLSPPLRFPRRPGSDYSSTSYSLNTQTRDVTALKLLTSDVRVSMYRQELQFRFL